MRSRPTTRSTIGRGRLAAPKAGHIHPTREPAEGLLHGPIETLLLDLDVERNLTGRDFGAGNLQ